MLNIKGREIDISRYKIPVGIAVILLGLLLTPFLLPAMVYQQMLESRLEESTGLDIEFKGDFSFSLLPSIRIEADTIEFSGKLIGNVDTLGTIRDAVLDVSPFQFLTGKIHVNEFLLLNPNVTINGNFIPFLPEVIRNFLKTSKKQDIRYLEVLMHFIEDSVFDSVQINEGVITWNKTAEEQLNAQQLTVFVEKPKEGKDFVTDAKVYINNRSVDMFVRLQRPDDFLRGFRSKLDFQLDSAPLRIDFNGSAAHRHSFIAEGDIRLDVPSVFEFCRWFSAEQRCDEDSSNVLVKSHVKIRDNRLQFEKATYTKNPYIYNMDGSIDFKRSTPELIGSITVPPRSVESFSDTLHDIEGINFNSLLLEAFDANLDVLFKQISFANGTTFNPRVKLLLNDGRLSVNADQIRLFNGLSNVRLRWHKGLENGYMDLRFDTHSLNLAEIQKTLGQNFNLDGTLKSSFEIQSEGSDLAGILSTARIHGDFSLLDGSLYNKDVVQSLSGNAADQMNFAEIKGRMRGNRGKVQADNIKVIAPHVNITGHGDFDMDALKLDLQLNSFIPTTNDSPSKEGFVKVFGPIDNLQLSTSVNNAAVTEVVEESISGLVPLFEEDTMSEPQDNGFLLEESDLLD